MAITKVSIGSMNDLKAVLESSGLFDTVEISGTAVTAYVDEYDSYVLWYTWGGSYTGSLYFYPTPYSSGENGIEIANVPNPNIAYVSSNGIMLVSGSRVPSSGQYHAFLLGKNENGKVAIAAMPVSGYTNRAPGTFKTAAVGETTDFNSTITVGYTTAGETPNTSQIVYAPIPTHPTSGVSTIQGAGLCLQTPLSDTCIVDIDGVKWATNGFLMLREG